MATTHERSRGLGELLRDLANGSADLLRGEATLARVELASVAANVGRGTALAALGGVLLLLGGLSLAAGIVLLVGDQWLPRDLYWLGALAVLVVAGVLAAFFARRGTQRLSPAELAPEQTVETLKENREWLRRRLKSGATSS